MSNLYYKSPKFKICSELPVNLLRYRDKMSEAKWDWLAHHLCGRDPRDNMMFPAAVPWCELTGETYD